ncbi:hypothetical protein [Alterisphingorhabdus coralli]|uniref:Uncharacterized protein n=1 Tax=Alterisphingorhabdus coralli TaxID=3071408 RepID=A0AA97FAL5_9SPHN|nr:hypothetical protein [Parasphingorhabdus sp. SCSIO 66989]WOE75565.1 hypothetical protein RB602_02290 [Parasphingorhabdus sp. SCSIO 66989]
MPGHCYPDSVERASPHISLKRRKPGSHNPDKPIEHFLGTQNNALSLEEKQKIIIGSLWLKCVYTSEREARDLMRDITFFVKDPEERKIMQPVLDAFEKVSIFDEHIWRD